MTEIKCIAVYSGSNFGARETYAQAANTLGRTIAERGMSVVYGGTHKGLMGAMADGALSAGGEVHGVLTERLQAKGHTHTNLTSVEVFPTMTARKARMIERADAFVALPGGIGTLEEFVEVWTLNQLGEVSKPAGLLSIEGYYDPLMAFVDHMIAEKFLPEAHRNAIVVADTPEALIDGLISFQPVTVPKWMS